MDKNHTVGHFFSDRLSVLADMKRLPNGTFALIFDAHTSSIYPPGATAPDNPPICVGNTTQPAAAAMVPAFRPCGVNESPNLGHNCLCSRESLHCTETGASTYMATTENWPDGPWRISAVPIGGVGWSPYNKTIGAPDHLRRPLLDLHSQQLFHLRFLPVRCPHLQDRLARAIHPRCC